MPPNNKKTPASSMPEDPVLDMALRPRTWDEFIGQEKIKQNLKIFAEAARQRGETLEHVLLYGNSGLGKTTLAHIIAKEQTSGIRVTSGPAIEKVGDLASILTNLKQNEVLFIDEAHRLNKAVEEILYPAMENNVLQLIIGRGPSARTLELELAPFTLIAATTRLSLISAPLRNRFGLTAHLDFYTASDIEKILERAAILLKINVEPQALKYLAGCSRRTPRVANRLLKRVRDYAQIKNAASISIAVTREALELFEIDELGLEKTDRRLLEAIMTKFNGGPVGLQTLAAAVLEEQDTILDICEPYLMQIGFLQRTPQGRMATKAAYAHLKMPHPKGGQATLV